MFSDDLDLEELQSKLLAWLAEKMPGARGLAVSEMARAGAGFTSLSLPFRLSWTEGGAPRSAGMVFRAPGRGDPVYPDPKLERQFRIMKCLQPTTVPVPRVYWMEEDEAPLGFPFYIMSRVEGLIPSEYPPYHSFGPCHDATREQRARMWWGIVEALAELHQLQWRELGLSFLGVPPGGTGPLDEELEYWGGYLDWAREEPQPVLEQAFGWLQENRYEPSRVTLCWGDARLPNAVFSAEGRVKALLDWDMAVLGNPESDLAFLVTFDWLLSEGTDVPRLEGFPSREETIARYQELTGRRVEEFFYNEVFATLRAALVVLRVQKNLQKMGVEIPGEDPILDNFCTRRLAKMLDLPPPSAWRPEGRAGQEASGTVQLHVNGPGGGDWYFVWEGGRVTRHAGVAEGAGATVRVRAEDWAAIQSGEINPFNAWTTGKLTVAGNHALYQRVSVAMARHGSD
jgi:aminoglycoside phosphotransferase (APT) family kinase protein